MHPQVYSGHGGRVLDAAWSHGSVRGMDHVLLQRSGAAVAHASRRRDGVAARAGVTTAAAELLLSADSDGVARMWCGSRPDAVLVFKGVNYGRGFAGAAAGAADAAYVVAASMKCVVDRWRGGWIVRRIDGSALCGSCVCSAVSKSRKPNPVYPAEVRCCSFFYMDKFTLTASSGQLFMHGYRLDSITVRRCSRVGWVSGWLVGR
jgi:hypothetical protein